MTDQEKISRYVDKAERYYEMYPQEGLTKSEFVDWFFEQRIKELQEDLRICKLRQA